MIVAITIDIGEIVLKLFAPLLEYIAPLMPGKTFSKFFFEMEIGQQALLGAEEGQGHKALGIEQPRLERERLL